MDKYYNQDTITTEYYKTIIQRMSETPDRHPYFLTTVFQFQQLNDQGGALKSGYQVDQIWKQYEAVYGQICSLITKSKPHKIRHSLYPTTFDFIDFGGTGSGSPTSLNDPHTPHVHSIFLIHPDTFNRFQNLIDEQFETIVRHKFMPHVISIDARPIIKEKKHIKTVVEYSTKLHSSYLGRDLHLAAGLINQFPKPKSAQPSRQNPRQAAIEKMKQLQNGR